MSHDGSVTDWLQQLQNGAQGEYQQQIWNRYFAQLVRVARTRLSRDVCRMEDEEDVVLSAFDSFFVRMNDGQFPELHDRTSLWPLLVTITVRKARGLHRRQTAQRRDVQRTILPSADDGSHNWLEQIARDSPTPELAAQAAEEAQQMIADLKRPALQSVAQLKLEGYSNAEIAESEGVMERSIERRLAVIRQIWAERADSDESRLT